MTTNTNPVTELLLSNNAGQAATNLLPETYTFDGNTFTIAGIGSATIPDAVIKAKFIQWYHADYKAAPVDTQKSLLSAFESGFLNKLHQTRSSSEPTTPISHVVDAATMEFWSIRSKFDNKKVTDDDIAILKALCELKDSSTKAQILDLVNKLTSSLYPIAERERIALAYEREELETKKFNALTAAGFTAIVHHPKTMSYTATCPDMTGKAIKELLTSASFELTSLKSDIITDVITITFIDAPTE